MMPIGLLLLYVAAINVACFGAFAWDKRAARLGASRIPERTLLQLAAVGGMPGALAARHLLRHKTRKEPFATRLLTIAGLQAVAALALCVPGIREALAAFVR